MKAKHLLFSSVFLSMGFAACTNEVEEFVAQTPDFEGVELSENFTISVKNSDFAASAETRALLNKVETNWIAQWEEGDAVGAAWFNKVTLDAEGKVSASKDLYTLIDEYGSNSEFKWKGGVEFESEAISKAGAYVLYHPYNEKLTDNFTDITVKEIGSPQPFDCADVDKQVSANIFAASVAEFEKGQAQAPTFTIEQIPNLYAVSFHIDEEALLKLDKEMEITQVIMEVTKSGKPAINTNGTIAPESYEITPANYNANVMPGVRFTSDPTTRIERMVIDVTNTEKDSQYHITELGKNGGTARFYFSMLPAGLESSELGDPNEDKFDLVEFKIVGKINGKTKVFGRKYTKDGVGSSYSAWSTLHNLMTGSGQVVELPVKLNYEASVQDGIYSADQFVEKWNDESAWDNGEISFNLQVPMDDELTQLGDKVNFALAEGKKVTFKGMPVTLPSISGAYSFESDVTIKGNATLLEGTTAENANIIVEGDLAADNYTFGGNVTVNAVEGVKGSGKLTTNSNVVFNKNKNLTVAGALDVLSGALTLGKKNTIGGAVNVKNKATLNAKTGAAIAGALTIYAGTEATLAGTWSAASVSVSGKFTFSGTATIVNKGKGGNFKVNKDATIVNTSAGTIKEMGALTVASGAEEVNIFAIVEKMGAITANEPVNINTKKNTKFVKTIINGDINANAAVTFGEYVYIQETGDVIANADVTFNGEISTAEEFKGIGNINGGIKDNAVVATTGKVNFAKVAKTGNINAGAKVVFSADATTGDINAAADVEFNGAANTGNITATTGIVKFLNGDKKATTGAITTETEMEFNGEAVTGDVTATNVPVTFKKAATVEDLIADGEKAIITFTDVNFSKTVDSNTSYFDVTLKGEAQLIANNISDADVVKVSDMYSKLEVKNSIFAKDLQAYGNADVNVAVESGIEKMTIEPGVTVTLTGAEAMTIGNLTTIKKGDYEGTLLTNNTKGVTVNGGKNEGKITGTAILTVNGMFTQNGEITPKSVTVGTDGDFTVAKSMTATITNNGHVTVNTKQNAKVTNKGTLDIEADATASVGNSGTTNVAKGATITLTSSNAGTINVVNGSIIKKTNNTFTTYTEKSGKVTAKVAYAWTGENNQPEGDILSFISQIDLYNATIKPAQVSACTVLKVINVSGTLTTDATFDWSSLSLKEINAVAKDNDKVVTFAGTKKNLSATASINVAENVTLDTDENVTFKNSTITLASGASFAGKKDGTVTVTM